MTWQDMTSPQRIDAIKRAYEVGDSAGLIGKKLGTSRNSIIGYYGRNPELAVDFPLRAAKVGPVERRPRAARKPRQNPKPRAVLPPDMPVAYSEPPRPTGTRLADLGRYQCRWAVNDAKRGEEHLFCGADGFPYCAHHTQMAIGWGTEGERSAHRALKRAMRG